MTLEFAYRGFGDEESSAPRIDRRTALKGIGAAGSVAMTGLAGCSTFGGGNDALTIGLQADLTGPLSAYGYWAERAVKGYVEDLNENGDGINGNDVELVVEDTASDSQQGVEAFRKLVQQNNADFVIGSQSSGVSIASNPIAKSTQTPYFPSGEADSIVAEDGNRWVVRPNMEVSDMSRQIVNWGTKNVTDSNWASIVQDFSFGIQFEQAGDKFLKEKTGDGFIKSVRVPLGTTDLTPYLNKIPSETEVLFNVITGPSSLTFLKQTAQLNTPGRRVGAIGAIEGVSVSDLGKQGEGATFVTPLPRELSGYDTKGHRYLREVAGVKDSDKAMIGGHYWSFFEGVSWVKQAAEAIDWSGEGDNKDLIRWFEEGQTVSASKQFPQGGKIMRGADHQIFPNWFVTQLTADGSLNVVEHIEVDEPPYPADVDLSAQSF